MDMTGWSRAEKKVFLDAMEKAMARKRWGNDTYFGMAAPSHTQDSMSVCNEAGFAASVSFVGKDEIVNPERITDKLGFTGDRAAQSCMLVDGTSGMSAAIDRARCVLDFASWHGLVPASADHIECVIVSDPRAAREHDIVDALACKSSSVIYNNTLIDTSQIGSTIVEIDENAFSVIGPIDGVGGNEQLDPCVAAAFPISEYRRRALANLYLACIVAEAAEHARKAFNGGRRDMFDSAYRISELAELIGLGHIERPRSWFSDCEKISSALRAAVLAPECSLGRGGWAYLDDDEQERAVEYRRFCKQISEVVSVWENAFGRLPATGKSKLEREEAFQQVVQAGKQAGIEPWIEAVATGRVCASDAFGVAGTSVAQESSRF